MAIRVAHIGTGNVGRLALAELIANPAFELTAVCVSSKDKVGKDAGELAGLGTVTGITATDIPVILGGGIWNMDADRVPNYGIQVQMIRGGKILPIN